MRAWLPGATAGFAGKAPVEARFMTAELGGAYRPYRARAPMLVPLIR